ncbi:MAG: sulfatase [Hyphomonas sp.]|uniref:sulfatase n=1 Tax=Hyphomonas sp. TaxID=87 RepID=UPI003527F4D8
MLKRVLVGITVLLLAGASLAWFNRQSIILYLATTRGKLDVAKTHSVEWMKGPDTPPPDRSNAPPNIIFILADDLGINDISTFGGGVADSRVPTPNIDRLAAGGAIFTTAYSGTATCAPSRAMLLTGRYPTRTGFEFTPTPPGMGRIVSMFAKDPLKAAGLPPMTWNKEADEGGVQYKDMGLPPSEVTIAEVLKSARYHTVHIGKWHLGRAPQFRAVSQGFDESLLLASGLYLPEGDPDAVNAKLDFDPIDKFLWARMQYAADYDRAGGPAVDEPFAPAGYVTDYYTDEALKVIDENRNRPFFLYLAHWGVHSPLQATREDYEAVGDIQPDRERVYAAMIHALDRSVGRILDKLEEDGLSDNTIIVFSSDNGGAGYIGLPEVNAPYRGWKITLFEGGIRVPMFIKWPRRIAPGTVIETPVAHIDVLPTLAEAAGAALPEGVELDGHSMLPLATGASNLIDRPGDAIFWSSGYYKVVRSGNWKLQVNERQGKKWLFDLATDPTEETNLVDAQPDKLAQLQALIDAHWLNARAPLYPYTTESPIRIDKTPVDPPGLDDEYVIWPN